MNMIRTIINQIHNSNTSKSKNFDWLILAVFIIIGCCLFSYQINGKSFWEDELYSIRDAIYIDIPHGRMWDEERGFSGPFGIRLSRAFYYLILRSWMFFGFSEIWIRSLSALFGLGCIYLTYQLARLIFNRKIAVIATVFLILSPNFIRYAQEARMYSLGTFLGLLGSLLILQSSKPITGQSQLLWGISRCLMILTAPININLFLADLTALMFESKYRAKIAYPLRFRLMAIMILIGSLPILVIAAIEERKWLKPGAEEPLNLWDWVHRFPEYLINLNQSPKDHILAVIICLLFAFSCFQLAKLARNAIGTESRNIIFLLMWTLVPNILFFAIAFKLPSIFRIRYSIFVQPFICIVIAWGIIHILNQLTSQEISVADKKIRSKPVLAISLTVAYLTIAFNGICQYYQEPSYQDWRTPISLLQAHVKSCDTFYYRFRSPVKYAVNLYAPSLRFKQIEEFFDGTEASKLILDYFNNSSPVTCNVWVLGLENHFSRSMSTLSTQVKTQGWEFVGVKLYRFGS